MHAADIRNAMMERLRIAPDDVQTRRELADLLDECGEDNLSRAQRLLCNLEMVASFTNPPFVPESRTTKRQITGVLRSFLESYLPEERRSPGTEAMVIIDFCWDIDLGVYYFRRRYDRHANILCKTPTEQLDDYRTLAHLPGTNCRPVFLKGFTIRF